LADDWRKEGQEGIMPLFMVLTRSEGDRRVPLQSYLAIMSETFAMMLSAAYTVGKTLTVATNYVMQDRQLLAKLQEELAVSWPDHTQGCPSQSVLEKFPYLVSCLALYKGYVKMALISWV
jgi:hypothetical protein